MWYLITQYWAWLLLALGLGLVIGWMTASPQPKQWGLLPLVLILAAVLFLTTFFRVVKGVPALWVESGLLMFGTYLIGCCLGTWLKGMMAPAMPLALASPVAVAPRPVTVPEREATVIMPRKPAADPNGDGAAAAAQVQASEMTAMPKVEGEDLIAGNRPAGLMAPRSGISDDLKLIRGIGRQNEGRLHGLGIWHFDQIAAWTADNVEWIGSYLAFPGRIEREGWVEQAKQLASGIETDFAQRVKRGQVSSSRDDGTHGQSNVASLADDGFEGMRPGNVLDSARGGQADDLKQINGVGRGIEERLNRLGIWHFDQIATMSDEELKFISHWAGFPGRALRENWKSHATALAAGDDPAPQQAGKETTVIALKPRSKG